MPATSSCPGEDVEQAASGFVRQELCQGKGERELRCVQGVTLMMGHGV